MAERIGRVEFLADLDGSKIPAEARRVGQEIARLGKQHGDSYGDEFESAFDKRLSRVGKNLAAKLGSEGRLAGNKFAEDMDRTLQSRFRRMSSNLAEILVDEDSFRRFAAGFDNVGDAARRLEKDLEALRNERIRVDEDSGRTELVLTKKEYDRYSAAVRSATKAEEARRAELDRVNAEQERLRLELEETEDRYHRLTRLIRDDDAFRGMAEEVGGIEEAHRRLRAELEEGGTALGKSRREIDAWGDDLERTKVRVEKATRVIVAEMDEVEHKPGLISRAFRRMARSVDNSWRRMDSTVRVVLGLILAAGDQVAVLGSALGAGLISVGGAAVSAVAGIGGVIAVISQLSGEIEDLPADMREAASELKSFKNSFSDLRTVITRGALGEMDGVFASLESSVRALSPALSAVGRSVGTVFSRFARAVRPGSEALEDISEMIDLAADNLPKLASAAGTLGGAFVRAFNRANPLTEQFLGWLQRIGDQFDAFTRSGDFVLWVENAQRVWGSFGGVLDSVSRTLNNLASPAAVDRTIELLDNLAGVAPVLGNIIDVVGRLDPLGILAKALNDIGTAIEPLMEPLGQLADVLRDRFMLAIEGVAAAMELMAPILAVGVDALKLLVTAVPPEALQALGFALTVLASQMAIAAAIPAVSRGVTAIIGWVDAAKGFVTGTDKMTGSATRMSGAFSKLSVIGVVLGAAISALTSFQEAVGDYDDNARQAIATSDDLASVLKGTLSDAASNFFGEVTQGTYDFITTTKGAQDALTQLVNVQNSGSFSRWVSDMALTNNESRALALALNNLDSQLSTLPLEAAQAKFQAWATSVSASDEQIIAMLNEMPQFKAQLEATAAQSGELATNQDLVAAAMGRGTFAAEANTEALAEMEGGAGLTETAVNDLAAAIRGFSSETLSAREANRQFEAAIDDVSASVEANGNKLDIATEKGRANQAALDALARASLEKAAATLEETGSQEDATAAVEKGRRALIDALKQFNITGDAAEAYADNLGLIPDDVDTWVQLNGVKAAENAIDKLVQPRTLQVRVQMNQSQLGGTGPRWGAQGGVFTGATRITAGEAGREALVPLDRPLHLVDPSVRAISAFAQGLKSPQPMARGGIVGGGVTVEAGAIQITAPDPWKAALETVNRITEMAVS